MKPYSAIILSLLLSLLGKSSYSWQDKEWTVLAAQSFLGARKTSRIFPSGVKVDKSHTTSGISLIGNSEQPIGNILIPMGFTS